jgi:hypothetical protein
VSGRQIPGKGWLQETGSGVFQLPGAGITREILTTSTLYATMEDAAGDLSGSFQTLEFLATLNATLEDAAGAFAGTTAIPTFTGILAATLEDVQGEMAGTRTVPEFAGTLAAILEDTAGDLAADYNVNVWRGISLFSDAWWASRRETGGDAVAAGVSPGWTQNAPLNPVTAAPWREAAPLDARLGTVWGQADTVDLPAGSGWREAPRQAAEVQTDWSYPPTHRLAQTLRHGTADATAAEFAQPFGFAVPLLPREAWAGWEDSRDSAALEWLFRAGQGTPAKMEITIVWQQGTGVEWVFGEGFFRPEPPEPWRYVPDPNLVFSCRLPVWDPLHLNLIFTRGGCPWYTPAPIHIGGTIFVENSILVVRLPDRKEIPVTSVRLALEADSWAWGLTLSLEGPNALDDISPVAGDPVSVEVTINGFVWVCQIEDFSESRSFGRTSWTANGRSIAAVLAAPYAPATTYTEDAPKVAAQLCEDRLTNTGWSMAYHDSLAQLMAIDWLVPGGTFSYASKTPLEAIGLIAAAIGARLYADRRYPILHLDPWYPALPWEWDAVTPDAILPEYLARQFSPNLSTKPAYNQVFVSGTNAYGQLVSVKRAGTAGNLAAPMVTDPLITHPLAGRERARTILGDTGKQAQVPVELPLVVDPGLLLPGYIVEVPESSGSWRGLVQSCAIEAAFPTVRHTATIERHYS